MTTIEMLTTFVDAARQLPETRHLKAAVKLAEKRIERLRVKKLQREGASAMRRCNAHCIECFNQLCDCNCWDEKRNCWLHSPISGNPMPSFIPAYFEVTRN